MTPAMDIARASRFAVAEDALQRIVDRLVAEFRPSAILLFGSQAYGVPHPNSDVDVLVVVRDDDELTFEHHRRGYACMRGVGVPVELHFCRAATLERFGDVIGSYYRDIKHRGRRLYVA